MSFKDSDDDLWAGAVAKYEKATGHKLKQDSAFSKIYSLDEFSKEVDYLAEKFSEFRNEHARFYSAMRKCIQPLDRVSDLAQAALGNSPYAPAAIVFGAAKYLLGACSTVSSAYDGLEALFEEISDITEQLQGTKINKMDTSLREKVTHILAFILEIIGTSEACIKRRRLKQWGRTVFLKEDSIQESITKLNKYIQSEIGLVVHLTYGRIGKMQEGLENLQAQMGMMATGMDMMRETVLSTQTGKYILSNARCLTDPWLGVHLSVNDHDSSVSPGCETEDYSIT